MKYNNAVAGYNQTNIGLKLISYLVSFPSPLLITFIVCYNQTNIGLKLNSFILSSISFLFSSSSEL